MISRTSTYRLVLSFLYFALNANAASQNITADDERPNGPGSTITYLPSNASWAQGNKLPGFAGLDISKPWATTWHNASADASTSVLPSVSIKFTGVAVFVYNVVQKAFQTDLTMTLDGAQSGTYQNPLTLIDVSNATIYWQIVYAVTGLENTEHTLIVALNDLRDTDNPYNLLLFDRAVYTTSDSVSQTELSTISPPGAVFGPATSTGSSLATSSSSPRISSNQVSSPGLSTGSAVGIAVGATAFTALCIGGLVILSRRRHPQREDMHSLGGTYSIVPWNPSRITSDAPGPRDNLDESLTVMQISGSSVDDYSGHPTQDHPEPVPTYEEAMYGDRRPPPSPHVGTAPTVYHKL